jgi:hypothetical protein
VELGNNAKYAVKGVGTTSFQLESGDSLHMRDVLFVPGVITPRFNPRLQMGVSLVTYKFDFILV